MTSLTVMINGTETTGLKQVTAEQYGAHVLLRNPSVKPC